MTLGEAKNRQMKEKTQHRLLVVFFADMMDQLLQNSLDYMELCEDQHPRVHHREREYDSVCILFFS